MARTEHRWPNWGYIVRPGFSVILILLKKTQLLYNPAVGPVADVQL